MRKAVPLSAVHAIAVAHDWDGEMDLGRWLDARLRQGEILNKALEEMQRAERHQERQAANEVYLKCRSMAQRRQNADGQ